MTTHPNGIIPGITPGNAPAVTDDGTDALHARRAQALAQLELDAWDDCLAALDLALLDATRHRSILAMLEAEAATVEAHAARDVEGKNETERKARLTLALAADGAYQDLHRAILSTQQQVRDSDRRAEVARQRARLHAAAVRVLTTDDRD